MTDLSNARNKTVIITGAANGIGAETARLFHRNGANVVIADLPSAQTAAQEVISSLSTERAIFVATNILEWKDMITLFAKAKEHFGRIDVVVANAGLIESQHLFELGDDTNGDPKEPTEHYRIIDVNVKGTMNTLTLAMHHMKQQEPLPDSRHKGSVVLIASTSGYFGGSGVMAYVASKHGVVGLLRACQKTAAKNLVRVNAIAPYLTPTHMTGSFSEEWVKQGLAANTALDVATAVAATALDEGLAGNTILVRCYGRTVFPILTRYKGSGKADKRDRSCSNSIDAHLAGSLHVRPTRCWRQILRVGRWICFTKSSGISLPLGDIRSDSIFDTAIYSNFSHLIIALVGVPSWRMSVRHPT